LVLGYNSAFGKDKAGDLALLRRMGAELGFEAREVPPVEVEGRTPSSSQIRRWIRLGNLDVAASLLGRPVTIEGVVVPGRGRGKDLGFPTANLRLLHEVRLPGGVYAGRVPLAGGARPAVINIGTAPTLGEDLPETVEVHVLDFEGDLYDAVLRVEMETHLRPEKRFDSVEALTAAIREDVRRARERMG
jgi:riboflavin kinase/FMN adenylyltransferase